MFSIFSPECVWPSGYRTYVWIKALKGHIISGWTKDNVIQKPTANINESHLLGSPDFNGFWSIEIIYIYISNNAMSRFRSWYRLTLLYLSILLTTSNIMSPVISWKKRFEVHHSNSPIRFSTYSQDDMHDDEWWPTYFLYVQ